MKDKLEQILKYLPAVTLLCYISGVLVVNGFLLQFSIYDSNVVNIRFIEAGILYLLFASFIVVFPILFSVEKKAKYFFTIVTSLFSFFLLNSIFGNMNGRFLLISHLVIFIIVTVLYLLSKFYEKQYQTGNIDLGELSLRIILFFIITILLFSFYYKEIKNNFGGGKSYQKILILKEKKDHILKTDSLLRSDKLEIIYENDIYFYFINKKMTISIKKDQVEGEMTNRE